MSLLAINGLTVKFGGLVAIDNLSFDVKEHSIHGLIGPNGAGKSTVFNVLSRFYNPTSGDITFDGDNLTKYAQHEVIGRGIARTFQNVVLFKGLSVWDNLMVGQHYRLKSNFLVDALHLPGMTRQEDEARDDAEYVMNLLGIAQYRDLYVDSLPYGIQKMVEFARALVAKPKLLLLDEPAAGLNHSETAGLGHTIQQIRDDFECTVLLVEHDMSLVMNTCEQITVIEFGRKIADGTPAEIQSNPAVIKAYLGEGEASA